MDELRRVQQELETSSFLSDLGARDRSFGRLALTIALGLLTAAVCIVVLMIVGGIATAFYLASSGQDPAQFMAMVTRVIQDPKHVLSFQETMLVLIFLGVANSLLFLSPVLTASLIAKRPFRAYITASSRFRWKLMLAGVGLFILVLGPVLAVGAWLDPSMPTYPMFRLTETAGQRLAYVLIGILCLFPAAFAEEVLFRGWLLKQIGAFTRNIWVLLLINGALFSLMHAPDIGPSAFLARTIMGAGFCYMVLRLGGLEFATGAHAANNILLLLFIQPLTIVPEPGQPFVPLMAIGALVEAAGYVLITEIVLRWPALREWTSAVVTPRVIQAEAF